MGNLCISGNKSKTNNRIGGSIDSTYADVKIFQDMDDEDVQQLVTDMKNYHLRCLRETLEKDPHMFVLNNLLMCIQFYDNFEKARDEAIIFKHTIDKEMTDLVAKDPVEGMILGEKRIELLTGMSQVIAQHYVYRGQALDNEDEVDAIYGGDHMKDTFLMEGIFPFEFLMSWENLEVYDISEYQTIKDYSDAKGASPVTRFCMEHPDKKTEFPKGYVRMRCVDEPLAFRKKLDIPSDTSDFGYAEATYSKPYSDGVPEAISESEGSLQHSSDDEETAAMIRMTEMVNKAKGFVPTKTRTTPNVSEPVPSTSRNIPVQPNFQRPKLKLNTANEPFPNLVIHAPTPPVSLDGSPDGKPFKFESPSLLFPHTQSNRILNRNGLSKSTPNLNDAHEGPLANGHSSGYSTTSMRSIASSIGSDILRQKWQQRNVKRLVDFGKKSRKYEIPVDGKYEPVPDNCYTQVKVEVAYEDLAKEDDDYNYESSEEEDSDDSEDGHYSSSEKKKEKSEATENIHFYLNSLQFSANACSEFATIAPKISIPESSLYHGAVLGTTIRCPIPYAYPKEKQNEDVGNYHITYCFTPSLHSKGWPKPFYFHFNRQVYEYTDKHQVQGEMWPSRNMMDKIEAAGCNALPLGYRPMDFFNTEQMLEWELSFQNSETILLESFRNPHWRAYTFVTILFRAFIAHLGPLGIGLEHIRNVMYFMCHENFSGWNDEQGGVHLKTLLNNLYDSLGNGRMPSFFIRSRNLLQSIPKKNVAFVHGHLSYIKDNLIIYCIHAFRNLMHVKKSEDSYVIPNLKDLYDLLTAPDVELIKMQNPVLRAQKEKDDEAKRALSREKARSKKKKHKKPPINFAEADDIDKEYFEQNSMQTDVHKKKDKTKKRLKEDYEKHMSKVEEIKRKKKEQRELRRLNKQPEHNIPKTEKRDSIDITKTPILPANFTPFRILFIIRFFMKQFVVMGRTALTKKDYGLATMYMLQVLNLCEIVQDEKFKDTLSPMEDDELSEYRQEALQMQQIIGKDVKDYVYNRLDIRSASPRQFESGLPMDDKLPSFTSNWDLRKLPTPPPSEKDGPSSQKKLEKPNIFSSLQSLPAQQPEAGPMSKRPHEERVMKRQESIKFVNAIIAEDIPPATPPRPLTRRPTIDLSYNVDETESTDL